MTDATVERVFGVTQAVGVVPPGGTPFILPHRARRSDNQSLDSGLTQAG